MPQGQPTNFDFTSTCGFHIQSPLLPPPHVPKTLPRPDLQCPRGPTPAPVHTDSSPSIPAVGWPLVPKFLSSRPSLYPLSESVQAVITTPHIHHTPGATASHLLLPASAVELQSSQWSWVFLLPTSSHPLLSSRGSPLPGITYHFLSLAFKAISQPNHHPSHTHTHTLPVTRSLAQLCQLGGRPLFSWLPHPPSLYHWHLYKSSPHLQGPQIHVAFFGHINMIEELPVFHGTSL